jgi:hypothetical protein
MFLQNYKIHPMRNQKFLNLIKLEEIYEQYCLILTEIFL